MLIKFLTEGNYKPVEGFSVGKIEFTAGDFPRLPAIYLHAYKTVLHHYFIMTSIKENFSACFGVISLLYLPNFVRKCIFFELPS